MCEGLLGVAFRGGMVNHICDGKLDIIDVLYAELVMKDFRMSTMQQHLDAKRQEHLKKNIVVAQSVLPKMKA